MDHNALSFIRRGDTHYQLFCPLNPHSKYFPPNLLRRKHGSLCYTCIPSCIYDGYSAFTERGKQRPRNSFPHCIFEQHGHEEYNIKVGGSLLSNVPEISLLSPLGIALGFHKYIYFNSINICVLASRNCTGYFLYI